MSLPTLLLEGNVRCFNFYWQGQIRAGMSFQGRLFALLSPYGEHERTMAFERGCELAAAHDVVMTVSSQSPIVYKLWLVLSPQAGHLLTANGSQPDTTECRGGGLPGRVSLA
jgi:hypothetical protein